MFSLKRRRGVNKFVCWWNLTSTKPLTALVFGMVLFILVFHNTDCSYDDSGMPDRTHEESIVMLWLNEGRDTVKMSVQE